jgi:uncharacterized membrane protein YccC
MNNDAGSPFESIESAREFVTLLSEAVAQAKQDVEADVQRESSSNSPRRQDALRTALYSMEKLEQHMNQSRRILNDLRSLRRLLFEERTAKPNPLPNAQSTNHEARGASARRKTRDCYQVTPSAVPQAD